MGSKYSGDYFRMRCEAEPRLTELSDDAAIRLLEGMVYSCRQDSCGDKIEFMRLVNDMLRRYSITIRDLYPEVKDTAMPKDPNGDDIDYDSLFTNCVNYDWRHELDIYIEGRLLAV